MKVVGIFEAKTHLSKICEEVAATNEPVTVTRRGKPLVRIDPVDVEPMTIRERRDLYTVAHGRDEQDDLNDFDPPVRSQEILDFGIED
jgi:prevent-host-death family protein